MRKYNKYLLLVEFKSGNRLLVWVDYFFNHNGQSTWMEGNSPPNNELLSDCIGIQGIPLVGSILQANEFVNVSVVCTDKGYEGQRPEVKS